ncbi:MAG: hypothetical protein JW810_07930 [Sedimentisphaerales bacterium]|nr:hypothetical protein [Sedimentisphaerales bacterium]
MFDRLSNDEITNALDELIACFGVKEEMPFYDFDDLLRKKDTEGCVQEIANRLGLPIRISLSYVPKDFKLGKTNGFRSSALSRTDWTGRGIEGIIAQVSIPQHLPMFGTSDLQGYTIVVRVSENCNAHPDTFVTIMAHELSHVLLASILSPHKDNEMYTDLVPILLGFRDVVRRGRKRIITLMDENKTTTHTTTYGYLTDSQFEFAYNYVAGLLRNHSHDKKRLISVVEQVQKKLIKATRSLANFRDYFRYLDIHPPMRMRKDHAKRVVQLHGQDYSIESERRFKEVRKSMDTAEAFALSLKHYCTSNVEQLKTHIRILEVAYEELDHAIEAITKDERILRKYVGYIYRLQKTLCRHF